MKRAFQLYAIRFCNVATIIQLLLSGQKIDGLIVSLPIRHPANQSLRKDEICGV